jgi:hypothetical protein
MTLIVHLLVDSRGWPAGLDPELVNATLQARLLPRLPLEIHAYDLDLRWFETLPRQEAVLFLLLTRPLMTGWQDAIRDWLSPEHRVYAAYLDSVDLDIRALAALTAAQNPPRAPYRIVLPNGVGLERMAQWMDSILRKLLEFTPTAPSVKVSTTRWRNLASNRQDSFYFPEQFSLSTQGAAGYRLTAASYRGKTHAHQGTFREDATAIAATAYWNILAVADGAGTARLARVGSNLAVTSAIKAMSDAMPMRPVTEDLGRAIWAGLRAAHQAVTSFAEDQNLSVTDLHTTLQLLIHWPMDDGCLVGVAHVGDGIIAAETTDGQYYLLTEPDTDPDDSGRTLFLTSGPLRQWLERTKVYQFDEPLDVVALMTDGLSGDLEPYSDLLHTHLFEALRQRVLCYPLRQREQALLAFISYDRRGSFDDRTLAVLSRE